jgi:hypothetical protein
VTHLAGNGWVGQITCTCAPAQVEGHADGVPFYFHNRYGVNSFGLGDDPVAVVLQEAPGYSHFQAFVGVLDLEVPTDRDEACAYIDWCLTEAATPQGSTAP